jgi:hypothetical protein
MKMKSRKLEEYQEFQICLDIGDQEFEFDVRVCADGEIKDAKCDELEKISDEIYERLQVEVDEILGTSCDTMAELGLCQSDFL